MTLNLSNSDIPEILRPEVARFWQNYQNSASEADRALLARHPQVLHSLPKVWACSPFVAKHCARRPELLSGLIDSGDLDSVYDRDAYARRISAVLPDAADEAVFMRALRLFRQREIVRIAWRDLAGWASLEENLRDLSCLADTVVKSTLAGLYTELCRRLGTPCNAQGDPQQMAVLAMGKLGGRELNFSSDIDLIFTYPESGQTRGVRRSFENQEFFVRLGQKLVQTLNSTTAEGLVFRVDMRLRPFGDSGQLAISFSALEGYYQAHAREWERYALIKCRAITGDEVPIQQLTAMLYPFIYRRYLDFGAFESLRDLKTQIDREIRRKGLEHNIKLGSGGIREIEFICQAIQLIRGGRQPAIQVRTLLLALDQLGAHEFLPADVIEQLRSAYTFLRKLEHRLQMIDDRQTQSLPDDELNHARLVYGMDSPDWETLLNILQAHRQKVHAHYNSVIVGPREDRQTQEFLHQRGLADFQYLWVHILEDENQAVEALKKAGFSDTSGALQRLRELKKGYSVYKLSSRAQQRMDTLIPLLLCQISAYSGKDVALQRTLALMETVARRSIYLALLIDHPQALSLLVRLCADSDWVASQIIRYPLLLDELLDPRRLYDVLKPEELDSAIHAQLAHLPVDDLELQMDTLRHFKRAQVLRVAATELTGNLSVEIASDYLTAVADSMARQALAIAWVDLQQKYGQPMYKDADGLHPARFCIVAYGKAGGIEMSYRSDLDIIFLHDSQGARQFTDGLKPIDNGVFFQRLAKRIIHLLTIQTSAGLLYEVDSRLRPDGGSGLLVSGLDAFKEYQSQDAWTWEHQALVRARAIAGDKSCMDRFENIRREVLGIHREIRELKREVREMRERMRKSLDVRAGFSLKHGKGGITDIEFIVQYGVLRWAVDYPDLLDTTGILPMLQRFVGKRLLPAEACEQMSTAYRTYRAEIHRLALQNRRTVADDTKFSEHRAQVMKIWEEVMEV
ncbi:MAG: bifunctional [glutamate--ammonia ligase]-adenylyl-L-tyrosine phosphorylase/[glutamate--ammonia-ligase] adenylyltransferase [Gammaproteobacteria bacterium]|nr:bifunctional [glutamate--ammonia ligase]-adenylyl-L-tyrosine phosphorylase/[glutamate--ammonia-ligase] adenylyltransferase [Gammaproteobacteria bacterium]